MKSYFKNMDKTLLILMIIFTIVGLVMIFSASSITAVLYNKVEESFFFKRQIVIVAASWAICCFFVLNIPTKKYQKLAPIGIIIIISLLILLFPYGTIRNSAKSWFDLGFYDLQPSEFAKSILIVFMAVYYERLYKNNKFSFIQVIIPLITAIIIGALVGLQPDLGTAAIICGIAFFLFLSINVKSKPVRILKISSLILAVGAIVAILLFGFSLNSEQSSRLNFRNPCTRYTEKTGYQVCNGFIAISNGGLFGVGLGNSTQKYLYLPEAYTDFVFPIIIEELGALIGIVIIACYIWMMKRILKIAKEASTIRGSIIAYGTFLFILLHLLVNFMGVLALVPLTGVPIPFLSYGGSFYMNLIFLLFLTQKVKIETVNDKRKQLLRSF